MRAARPRIILAALLLCLLSAAAFAANNFPPLTGRVVDAAHILSPGTITGLDQKLAGYERGTGNQVVVATIPSLNGDTIEDYGYQLGRAWGIGQKDRNNGVLLIVAPAEHKVRIEVGYGLEGQLTDLAASEIVRNIMTPRFKAGQMEDGVVAGTDAILSVLGGQSLPQQAAQHDRQQGLPGGVMIFLIILFLLLRLRLWPLLFLGSSFRSDGWGSGGGFGGGGFSGGGGSFGGGGASGSW